jgi:4-hydroxy-tetrahydrodipicolinate reductase
VVRRREALFRHDAQRLNMSATELPIAILGVTGRMGGALLRALDESPSTRLSGASASSSSRWLKQDAGAPSSGAVRGITISDDPSAAVRGARVAIDFALPDGTPANLRACVAAKCALVIGTTGLSEETKAQITAAAKQIPIVLSANMSVGVNLLMKLTELAAKSLDTSYDIEIFEAHHRNKKDAPSGTALALGDSAALGRGVSLQDVGVFERHGETGARTPGSIGFSVFRGGDVIGDHTVSFAGNGERLELSHRASDRMMFARGAVRAAQWIVNRPAGLYSMQDVLGLRE